MKATLQVGIFLKVLFCPLQC